MGLQAPLNLTPNHFLQQVVPVDYNVKDIYGCSRKISSTQIGKILESQDAEIELNSGGTGELLKVLGKEGEFIRLVDTIRYERYTYTSRVLVYREVLETILISGHCQSPLLVCEEAPSSP